MKGYVDNIEDRAQESTDFRRVVYTGQNLQLVLMSLKPGEEIGTEVHDADQFFRFEAGEGVVIIDGTEHQVEDDFAVVVPEGATHNVINTSQTDDLKLYTIYAPPHHQDGTIHPTKAEAETADEHFDGHTSEGEK